MPPKPAASVASAMSSSVLAYGAGGYCSAVETPTAPSFIAWRTSDFIWSSSAGPGGRATAPSAPGRADVAGKIDADALLVKLGEVAGECAPVGNYAEVLIGHPVGPDNVVVQRRRRFALACDLGGDSLVNLGRQVRVDQDGHLRLAEHVDEPG